MRKLHRLTVLPLLLLFGATACGDLVVDNPNDPTREMALTNPGDIQSLVTSAFQTWWLGNNSYNGTMLFVSAAAMQHTSMAANACMVNCSSVPRTPIINDQVDQYYGNMSYTWEAIYSALAGIADGLRSIEADPELAAAFSDDELATTRAFARFVQALGHASAAAIYEGGFIVTEETTVFDENGVWQPLGEPLGYMELHNRAMEMFDEFIEIAEANPELVFERPWIASEAMTLGDMVPVAHSFKARYMSQVARTPAERDALDWGAIIEEAEAGLFTPGEAWEQDVSYIRTNWSSYPGGYYMGINFSAWQQVPYFYIGMADPDGGDYLDWLELPVFQRNARIDMDDDGAVEPVTIVTPDLRFPQGETLAEQQDDWRTRGAGGPQVFSATQTQAHVNPARGTWRWSYYSAELPYEQWISITAPVYHVNARETRLIAAEGYLRQGDAGAAADIIDETRVAVAGLDPSGDGNDMCVPRLPNGECGDLFEMLKWEKRMEVWGQGTLNSTWFFDSRGWGDLYHNTFLHLPVPAAEAQLLGLDDPYHTHGGGEGASAGVSTYQFPHEG